MTAPTTCKSCGTEPLHAARFCHACGAPIASSSPSAEYKQVTVLFADVVHSMDIAAAVGAERLRDIMTELFEGSAAVVERFGGTVDKFTGDGIMALFGAPIALEDHAFRACVAALEIQREAGLLAAEVEGRDGITLHLRVGLNSGEVIAGEIGSNPMSYTAIGAQVGMAQRMEAVAPPGGVMLTESTVRLVQDNAVLDEAEMARVKGADVPVPAYRLRSMAARRPVQARASTLVGRQWELVALAGMADRSVCGHGSVIGVVGPAGIGKSRIVAETTAIAASRGAQVFSTFCESHASEIPFHVVARLLRAAFGIDELADDDEARAQVRTQIPGAQSDDMLLLDDLLGISEPGVEQPDIAPEARRRRLTALVNDVSLARSKPSVYVIEDAHWIDQVSESMLADFLSVVPRTRSLVLITYRPEYGGVLTCTPGGQTIALAPLDDSETAALIAELLGADPSVTALTEQIAERAAGNPFFVQEIVRDLADRGVLQGARGAYVCPDPADVSVPASLQAAIAARIDRLDGAAKRTLNAAAVIGMRFRGDLLAAVVSDTALAELLHEELIDQVMFTPRAQYAFRHPLIRAVAYGSQLKSTRADLHRRLAGAIEQQDPGSADENAALIAEHCDAAGDLHAAYGWHMRAGSWLTYRDLSSARMSWHRARQVADRLPAEDPDSTAMRIEPRAVLCASAWRVGGSVADTGFEELRDLTTMAGDKRSLAIGMSGQLMTLTFHAELRESSRLATEHADLLESIGDAELTVGLIQGAIISKWQAGEMVEALRLAQRAIDLAHGDLALGNLVVGSPLAMVTATRGAAASSLGRAGWMEDFNTAIAMAREFDPFSRVFTVMFKTIAILNGVLVPDEGTLRDTAEVLELAEQSGDDFTLANAQLARGVALVHRDDPAARQLAFEMFEVVRQVALQERLTICAVWCFDMSIAREKVRSGDLDGAIDLSRAVVDNEFRSGEMVYRGPAISVLVEALLARHAQGDLEEAQAAVDRLAAVPTDPGFVLYDVPVLRLRALLARAHGDDSGYREFADRYRKLATSLGFKGHMTIANEMT
jgi:adenylate cyclase